MSVSWQLTALAPTAKLTATNNHT